LVKLLNSTTVTKVRSKSMGKFFIIWLFFWPFN
jgi:hypothetical protein